MSSMEDGWGPEPPWGGRDHSPSVIAHVHTLRGCGLPEPVSPSIQKMTQGLACSDSAEGCDDGLIALWLLCKVPPVQAGTALPGRPPRGFGRISPCDPCVSECVPRSSCSKSLFRS